MTSTAQSGTRRRRAVAALVAGGALVTVGGLASGAFFTDSASIDNNTFAFGTVELSTNPTTALVSMPAMQPGDSVTKPLAVNNDGTMELRYSVSDVVTNDKLGSALVLTVKERVGASCDAFDGKTLYTGVLGAQAGTKVLGDKTPGNQDGDRVVAAKGTDNLCVRVDAPKGAIDNTFKGLTTSATFTFDAEQTANNA